MSSNVTVKQVAEEVGLSLSTVIQILGKYGHRYRKETRDKVYEAAQRLGYMPNASARAMRSGSFRAVGFLMSADWGRSYLPITLLDGIHTELAKYELALTLSQLPNEQLASKGEIPQILRQLMVDGLLINYNASFPTSLMDVIDNHILPTVWMNLQRATNAVRPDDFGGGKMLAESLIKLGHKHITYADFGTWEAPTPSHYSVQDRKAGYEAAMNDAGLECSYFCDAPPIASIPERRYKYALECLSHKPLPTAIITYMDYTALPLLIAALKLGMKFPEDLTLATFKDRICNESGIQIATAITPMWPMGKAAVAMLQQRIKNPGEAIESQLIPFTLETGDTWGSPR